MTKNCYLVGRNNPAHILSPILQRQNNQLQQLSIKKTKQLQKSVSSGDITRGKKKEKSNTKQGSFFTLLPPSCSGEPQEDAGGAGDPRHPHGASHHSGHHDKAVGCRALLTCHGEAPLLSSRGESTKQRGEGRKSAGKAMALTPLSPPLLPPLETWGKKRERSPKHCSRSAHQKHKQRIGAREPSPFPSSSESKASR